ncbi:hypothetical protein DDZ18_07135 [Marinicauda salina]|uniref:Uncharacterized protein n=1 Tax=Marinicauda salina TaxID=2135793 RepID=A0A2U2BTY0_9PROT|nr:hypothetical protein [Marinicauda salina]PWE17447.1 hypothetical protein DDZ18_07135 [Marinicauda salina]
MLDETFETRRKARPENFFGRPGAAEQGGAPMSREFARFTEKTHQMSNQLVDGYVRAAADYQAYLEFRKDNKLTRVAQYPDSNIMHFSILAGLVLFEGLANAYFFSKGSDLGLLGGWIQAITVAFTNVIASFFLIGFLGLRFLQNPTRPFSFAAAAVGVPIVVVLIGFLNFSAGHYRDLLELNAATLALGDTDVTGEILAPVTRALSFQPFETLEALLLFILGITFAAIAAFKGATFDDRTVGYGAAQRRAKRSASYLAAVLKQAPSNIGDGESDSVGAEYHASSRELLEEIREFFAEETERAREDFDAMRDSREDAGGRGRGRRAPPPYARD